MKFDPLDGSHQLCLQLSTKPKSINYRRSISYPANP